MQKHCPLKLSQTAIPFGSMFKQWALKPGIFAHSESNSQALHCPPFPQIGVLSESSCPIIKHSGLQIGG